MFLFYAAIRRKATPRIKRVTCTSVPLFIHAKYCRNLITSGVDTTSPGRHFLTTQSVRKQRIVLDVSGGCVVIGKGVSVSERSQKAQIPITLGSVRSSQAIRREKEKNAA
jgi:hypothetical protein